MKTFRMEMMRRLPLLVGFLLLTSPFFFFLGKGNATSIDWQGRYRLEYIYMDRPYLDDPKGTLAYFSHFFSLRPKIIIADGFNVYSSIDFFGNPSYPDSQVGQLLGAGISRSLGNSGGSGSSGTPQSGQSALIANNQMTTAPQISELYLNMNHEYGMLVAGRIPLHFGLGMTYNSGQGPWDHWYTREDVIGYKFLIGNMTLNPMLGRLYDYSLSAGDEITDLIWDIRYANPETASEVGVFYVTRSAAMSVNDIDLPYQNLGTKTSGWSSNNVNLYYGRGLEFMRVGLEAGFNSGTTGLSSAAGDGIKVSSFGLALELEGVRKTRSWNWQIKAGAASGDNPSSSDSLESFFFHRNYDVGMLLFNHPMGQYDLFQTNPQRPAIVTATSGGSGGSTPGTATVATVGSAADEETISNAMYVAPSFTYWQTNRLSYGTTLVWGQLQTLPLSNSEITKDLGLEVDLRLDYKVHERITWRNELGVLFPGGAWKGGTQGFGASVNYGLQSMLSMEF